MRPHSTPGKAAGRRPAGIAALAAVLIALLAPALTAPPATAAPAQGTIFDAGSYLLNATADQRQARIRELKGFGVDTVRVVLQWRYLVPKPNAAQRPAGFGPSDPDQYPRRRWAPLDAAVRGIRAEGMRVLLTPSGPVPDWASASGRSAFAEPKPAEFKRFVTAVGRRYGGSFRPRAECLPLICPGTDPRDSPLPNVRHWAIYNEANLEIFLRPQFKHGRPYSPRLYRRLFLAAREGLAKSGHGRDAVLIGETATSGGRKGVDPIPFMRGVFCLDRNFRRVGGCAPIRAAGFSHHPYAPGLAPFERPRNPGQITLANLGRLATALRRAAAAGATAGRLGLHLTEYGVQSVPDRQFGVGLARQAEYLGISEYIAYRNRSVRNYSQYLMEDDPSSFQYSFTTGLRRHSGRRKPSYRAFRLALAVRRVGRRRVLIWGHYRPGGRRRVTIFVRRRGGGERKLRSVGASARGYFRIRSSYAPGRKWRAVAQTPGSDFKGTFVRAYRFG